MAGTNGSLHKTHLPNQTLDHLHAALDPKSLILSHFQSNQEEKPSSLQLTTESFAMERGPRYKAYSDLREKNLRMKQSRNQPIEKEKEPSLSPLKKQGKLLPQKTGYSVLAQSVPDFAAVVRKENRRPPPGMMPTVTEEKKSMTPPAKSSRKTWYGPGPGSKSANSGEKRSGGILMGRKSYACLDELKGFSAAAASAINGENRGGRSVRGGGGGVGKTVLGYRQY